MNLVDIGIFEIVIWMAVGFLVGKFYKTFSNKRDESRQIPIEVVGILGGLTGGMLGMLVFEGGNIPVFIPSLITVLVVVLALFLVRKVLNPADRMANIRFNQSPVYYSRISPVRSRNKLAEFGEVRTFISGVAYPVSKRDLIDSAERSNAPRTVLNTLEKIGDHIYDSQQQIGDEIEKFG